MRVDAHVADGAGETLVILEGDVASGQRIDVFLGEAEIDDVDDFVAMRRLTTDEEILRFDIPARNEEASRIRRE